MLFILLFLLIFIACLIVVTIFDFNYFIVNFILFFISIFAALFVGDLISIPIMKNSPKTQKEIVIDNLSMNEDGSFYNIIDEKGRISYQYTTFKFIDGKRFEINKSINSGFFKDIYISKTDTKEPSIVAYTTVLDNKFLSFLITESSYSEITKDKIVIYVPEK